MMHMNQPQPITIQPAATVGGRIRQARRAVGLSQAQLAEQIDASLRSVGQWEGLDGRSSHVLRRTCATALLEGGVATVVDVQEVLGHASLSSTTRYLARPAATRLLGAIETGPLGDAA